MDGQSGGRAREALGIVQAWLGAQLALATKREDTMQAQVVAAAAAVAEASTRAVADLPSTIAEGLAGGVAAAAARASEHWAAAMDANGRQLTAAAAEQRQAAVRAIEAWAASVASTLGPSVAPRSIESRAYVPAHGSLARVRLVIQSTRLRARTRRMRYVRAGAKFDPYDCD